MTRTKLDDQKFVTVNMSVYDENGPYFVKIDFNYKHDFDLFDSNSYYSTIKSISEKYDEIEDKKYTLVKSTETILEYVIKLTTEEKNGIFSNAEETNFSKGMINSITIPNFRENVSTLFFEVNSSYVYYLVGRDFYYYSKKKIDTVSIAMNDEYRNHPEYAI